MDEASQGADLAYRTPTTTQPSRPLGPGGMQRPQAREPVNAEASERYKAVMWNRAKLLAVKADTLDETTARETVQQDIGALRAIESARERYRAAAAMADNALDHRSYRAQLRLQDPTIATEVAAASTQRAESMRLTLVLENRERLRSLPRDALDETSAHGAVRLDLAALRGIEGTNARYHAAVAMADNAKEHANYRAELRQQDAVVAKEIKRAAIRQSDQMVAAVLRDGERQTDNTTSRDEFVQGGQPGITRQTGEIVDDTARRDVQSIDRESVRLAGRSRAGEDDETTLAAERAVRVMREWTDPDHRAMTGHSMRSPPGSRVGLDAAIQAESIDSDNHPDRRITVEESKSADETSAPRKGAQAGARLHDIGQVPHAMRQEAQARWGVNVELNAARENGHYSGPVFTSTEYVAQRVGNNSVVIHRREDIDFTTSENLTKRQDSNRLNDVNLAIRYDGDTAKAHFHDPQRAAIEDMFRRIEKAAEQTIAKPKARETFVNHLEAVKEHMVERYREAKNRQFEARTSHAQERTTPDARENSAVER